ncbi:MAG: DUF4424 domain-containing protein [Pseudomonadota bacterium]
MKRSGRLLSAMAAVGLSAVAVDASANDTSAALGTGGLQFVQSDSVEMRSEDLFVSEKEIRVRYVFRNRSAADVTTIVAFPMPDITFSEGMAVEIPDRGSDNFLDFRTVVDGTPVQAAVERRVFALGLDRTRLLVDHKVPLMPFGEATEAALDALPEAVKAELVRSGVAHVEEYDAGKGMQKHLSPLNWTLKTTWYWTQTFPAGKDLVIEHRYRPSVGGSVQTRVGVESKDRFDIEQERRMAEAYCIEREFRSAVARAGSRFAESRISYILKTGSNWLGPIADFTLTVDKGAAENLISFCGSGVKKVGPTTFQMKAKDFYPERDLDVLILKPLR